MRPSVDAWPLPVLDRAGQEAFWDRQSKTYGLADMTRDNLGELEAVERFCADFVSRGYQAEDTVTLGGAIGCRDPLVVTDALERLGQGVKKIFFNDLSKPMIEAALEGALSKYPVQNIQIETLCGPIHEIAHRIAPLSRRVIIGFYSAEGFTEARPEEGYPYAGLEEYLRNADVLGDRFTVEPVGLKDGCYENLNAVMSLTSSASMEELRRRLSSLRLIRNERGLGAIRVIGQHVKKSGFFISHWFTESGILDLMRTCFSAARLKTMVIRPCAKGFVVCIDPVTSPRGIVTILNNVVGNVLPHEHLDTLRSIDRMSA